MKRVSGLMAVIHSLWGIVLLLSGATPLSLGISQPGWGQTTSLETSGAPCALNAMASNSSGTWAVYITQPLSNSIYKLTPATVEDRNPAWSPDGAYLAFERRQNNNWDIYIQHIPSGKVQRITDHTAFDGEPSWSSDGKTLAFTTARDGNLEIYTVTLPELELQRVTNTPDAEVSPEWLGNDGSLIYISWHNGTNTVYSANPQRTRLLPLLIGQEIGQVATSSSRANWAYVEVVQGIAAIVLSDQSQHDQRPRVPPQDHLQSPAWDPQTETWVGLRLVGGNRYEYPQGWMLASASNRAVSAPMLLPGHWESLSCAASLLEPSDLSQYQKIEFDTTEVADQAPLSSSGPSPLIMIPDIIALQARFAQEVAPDFKQLRAAIIRESGYDVLGELNDGWRDISSPSGATFSWHKAGRAFDTRFWMNDSQGKSILYLAKEELRGEVYFRLYIRAKSQDGTQGEPLRRSLWVIPQMQRYSEVEGYSIPPVTGYFVDFTDLAQRHGWERISAANQPDFNWRTNFYALEYWHYEKRDNLCWYEALSKVYSIERLNEFVNYHKLIDKGHSRQELRYFCVPEPRVTLLAKYKKLLPE